MVSQQQKVHCYVWSYESKFVTMVLVLVPNNIWGGLTKYEISHMLA
jgi:hypothetical protein